MRCKYMEKIRVLCATAKNEIGKNIIDDFLKLLLEINVKIEKQERKYLEDYNYEIIEEYEQDSLNLISINGEFQYRSNKCKFDIQRMTKDNQFLLDIQIVYLEIDDIRDLKNSQWFDFKEILLNKISEKYEYIYWLEDTQNQKMATELYLNQRIIAENAQFTGIAAGRGVGFTTGLLLLREGLGMRETPIRPHSWH